MQLVGFTASSLADCSLSPVTVDVVAAYITRDGLHCLLLPAKAFSVANIACTVPTAAQLSAYVRCDRRGDKGRARACTTCLPRRRLISACDAMNWKRTLASPAHIMLGKNCLTSIKCAPSYYYVSPSSWILGDKELS